ncbi:MAG: right-handed parallel beta-helix repeat-containing protein, partial [Ignavibacteria bacterium]
MKKIATIIFLIIYSNCYSNYTTPGTGVVWNLDSLVTFSAGNVTFASGNYLVNDTITIAASDTVKILDNTTMKFGTGVFIDINGVLIINPPDSATITAQDTSLKYIGLKFEDLSDGSLLKRLIFEYGNSIRMLNCDILIDSCIIRYNTFVSSASSGAISFFGSNSTVSNCKIFRNRRSGLISGLTAAFPSSPKILNNLIYENNVTNENYPQINLGNSSSNPLTIKGNTIIGLFNMAGAIGVSSLLGLTPNAIIENNVLKHNRYGIAILGNNANVYINNNIIDSNNIQGVPSLG